MGLFWDKHTHVYLLTYLPRTHTGRAYIDRKRVASKTEGQNETEVDLAGNNVLLLRAVSNI